MGTPDTWAIDLINRMEDGTYWHIPESDCILRIDKPKNRFVLIKGQMGSTELNSVKRLLSEVGYHIITREEETPL